jgi:hypothetical protein
MKINHPCNEAIQKIIRFKIFTIFNFKILVDNKNSFFCICKLIYFYSHSCRLETTLNYGLERVWCITAQRGSNTVAIGYDEGSVTIKLGREEPAVSMDSTGKVLWAKHTDVQQANLRTIDEHMLEAAQGNI